MGGLSGPAMEASARVEARLLRWDAAIRRSFEALERAGAAGERRNTSGIEADPRPLDLRGADDSKSDERDRIANEREARADERDRIADGREAEADEREERADERDKALNERERLLRRREAEIDERERTEGTVASQATRLSERGAILRDLAADLAERMADHADQFAAYLEKTRTRGDRDLRHALSQTEREIARIERRNAAKLKDPYRKHEPLERLPRLFGA